MKPAVDYPVKKSITFDSFFTYNSQFIISLQYGEQLGTCLISYVCFGSKYINKPQIV